MADYYTKFSLILTLPNQEAQTYALDLANLASSIQSGDDAPATFPADLKEVLEIWTFDAVSDNRDNKWALWLHSEEGGIDAVCSFIQHLLQKFDPSGRVEFEWSNDCSKPRTDAYGGGAAIVTVKEIKSMSTSEWLQQNAA